MLRYGTGVQGTGYTSGQVFAVMPSWLAELAKRLVSAPDGIWRVESNAISVNEYLPRQSISLHTDRPEAGPVVSSLSLASDAVMLFRETKQRRLFEVPVPRRTLVHMTGLCRDAPWRHGIAPVVERRISIVFRYGAVNA